MDRKIHWNAVLKNLPAEKQAAIVEYIDGPVRHSLKTTAKWLKRGRIKASTSMVGQFRRWYLLRQKMESSSELSVEWAKECKKKGWVKTIKEERIAAQVFFNRLVLEDGNPKMWSMVERVNLLKDKVELDEKKVELDLQKYKDKTAEGKKENDNTGLSPEEKRAAIRQIYGMS